MLIPMEYIVYHYIKEEVVDFYSVCNFFFQLKLLMLVISAVDPEGEAA